MSGKRRVTEGLIGTAFVARGVRRQVMELLGHSDIRLTANTYAHVAPVVARDTADRMDHVFAGGDR